MGLLVLSSGALSLHPQKGLLAVLSSPSLGGRLSRVLLPWFFAAADRLTRHQEPESKILVCHAGCGRWARGADNHQSAVGAALDGGAIAQPARRKTSGCLAIRPRNRAALPANCYASSPPMTLHRSDGRILEVNDAWVELSGYSLEDTPTVEAWLGKSLRT